MSTTTFPHLFCFDIPEVSYTHHQDSISLLSHCSGSVSYTHLYSVSYNASNDVVNKLHKFNLMCGTIRRTLKSASKGTRLKFYKVMALPTLIGLRIGL